ncbi:MAG TPA: hypothetical protein VLG50_00030 [Candidatus Saccharimonadales bacterium]|nr:hypothetical protein [Candidatus Saccharimonadales bacterium]
MKKLFLVATFISLNICPMLSPRTATKVQEELARCTIQNECLENLTDISAQAMKGMTFSASRAHELVHTQRTLIETQSKLIETSNAAAKSAAQATEVAHPFSKQAITASIFIQLRELVIGKAIVAVTSFAQNKIQQPT